MFTNINIQNILSNINKYIKIINDAIPIYKKAVPIYKNIRTVINTSKTINESQQKKIINEIRAFERPNDYKRKTNIQFNKNLNIDDLTIFN